MGRGGRDWVDGVRAIGGDEILGDKMRGGQGTRGAVR